MICYYIGLTTTKHVFRVSDKARLKPVASAIETSWKIEIALVASLDVNIQYVNNKDVNQTARMLRLVCAFVVCQPPKSYFLASRLIFSIAFIVFWISCYCKCPVAYPHSASGWSVVFDCSIFLTYSLTFCFHVCLLVLSFCQFCTVTWIIL